MNKSELIQKVSNDTQKKQSDIKIILESILENIKDATASDEVRLMGFGTFKKIIKHERIGINPQTLEPLTIPAKKVVKFKPSKEF